MTCKLNKRQYKDIIAVKLWIIAHNYNYSSITEYNEFYLVNVA